MYEVVPRVGGRDARIKSERLKKAQIKDVAEVRKERRHRDARLERPTEHQDTEARKQSGTQPKNHEANKTLRRRKNR